MKKIRTAFFIFLSSLLFVVMGAGGPGFAQFLPSSLTDTEKDAPKGLDVLLQEAQANGSTVIVVRPGGDDEAQQQANDDMKAARFLQAREQINRILHSFPSLLPNIKRSFMAASPDGHWLWIFKALGITLMGILASTLATRPIISWSINLIETRFSEDPKTTADKLMYLLFRTFLAAIFMGLYFVVAMLIAIIFDSGHEPSRRIIFESVIAYLVYKFLRHGVSWNLFSGGEPRYRVINLSDTEAKTMHRHFQVGVAFCAIAAAMGRYFSFTGMDQIAVGLPGVLTVENIKLIQIFSAVVATLSLLFFVVKNRHSLTRIFAPLNKHGLFYHMRNALARLAPLAISVYILFAFGVFIFRLALEQPAPGLIIGMPLLIGYLAIIAYAVILILIQAFYDRRYKRFAALAQAERERHQQERAQLDIAAGEEMIVQQDGLSFEYRPMFRGFFENVALACISIFSLGEVARSWGISIGENNFWTSALDILLASCLCWIAYSAATAFINKRMEEEGGVPSLEDEEEMGGEGGGAGATRMATLLPILRYVLITIIFSIAGMVILSRLGVDIAPIFAGAGVVGIAVGFGAQTLIRDIFSGAFFLMDDAFRKGEYVEIEGIRGTVEKISVRSFQLRHHLGALHTIPFGEIKQLTNYSRDWVMMKLPLRVTYDTDVEKVRKLVKKLGQRLLEHPQVGHTFLQPLKSQGVYKMEDSAMIIRVKFMTKPGEQFVTRKVVYESIQELFAREGIHFAHKEVTVRLADDSVEKLNEQEKQAVSAAARTVIDAEVEALAEGGAKPGGGR